MGNNVRPKKRKFFYPFVVFFSSMIFKKVKRQLIKIYEGLTLKAEKPLGNWAKNENKNSARNNARINVS